MKRVMLSALGLYLFAALWGLVREQRGELRCGCSSDCWCKRPGLNVFRWVFPYGHRVARDEG